MNIYFFSLLIIGISGLGMTWIPALAKKICISYSLVFVAFGMLIYLVFPDLNWPDPLKDTKLTLHFTEIIVIIAIMGTGLKIDRALSFKKWRAPLQLLTITMFLNITAIAAISHFMLGFDIASSILLGAVLSPTDPVLAGDVQVDEPNKGKSDDVKFSLTAEAGMNDGLAFPFVWLAILILGISTNNDWAIEWLGFYIIYKIICGIILGFIAGKIVTYLFFKLPEKHNMLHVRDGLVALSATLFVYGATELLHGYGFIAVFVTALTIRNYEQDHEYHAKLHSFTDQIERVLLAVLLIIFGAIVLDGVLAPLTWPMIGLSIAAIFLIRPIFGYIGLIGTAVKESHKKAIGFLGIRGVGSLFYLTYGLEKGNFMYAPELWAITALTILASIFIHGMSAPLIVRYLNVDKDNNV